MTLATSDDLLTRRRVLRGAAAAAGLALALFGASTVSAGGDKGGKCNSGNGNGHETDPSNDCDPGNSGAHNQAWKNMDKPRNGGGRSF